MPDSETMRILPPSKDESQQPPRNYYIWGFQPHFGIGVKLAAEGLFKRLDDSITPDTLIVAVNFEGDSEQPFAVIEPVDHELQPVNFKNIMSLVAELEKVTPSPSFSYPKDDKQGAAWAESEKRNVFRSKVKDAIKQTIEGVYSFDARKVYVSPGREYGHYLVHTVLLLDKAVHASHPSLRNPRRGDFLVETSLVDAVATKFVISCYDAILSSFAGQVFAKVPELDAMLRSAGTSFMFTPFTACENFEGFYGGFEICCEISTLTYEKAIGRGRLILARTGHENVSESLSFRNPPKLRNYRAVRKLLQLAGEGEGLVCNSEDVVGIGAVDGNYDATKEDLFCVDFLGHSKWELTHGGVTLMRVEHGIPQLPKKKEQVRRFCETFARIFPLTDLKQRTAIKKIAEAATELEHGTILIVSEKAAEEAARFGGQSTRIEPQAISTKLLEKASRIDGAVLVSPDCMCHAIGVILDGKVNDRGSAERGARYNSTVRYVLGSAAPCIGVVISDDGMVNLVPEYRPIMSRREIEDQLNALRSLVDDPKVNQRKMNKLRERIIKTQFYFSEDQCREINELILKAEPKSDRSAPWIIEGELAPHSDMNETYLKD